MDEHQKIDHNLIRSNVATMSELEQYRMIERALLRLHRQELILGDYNDDAGSVCLVGAVSISMMYPQGILELEELGADSYYLADATVILGEMERRNERFGRPDKQSWTYDPNSRAKRKERWQHAYRFACQQIRALGEQPTPVKEVKGRLVPA